MTTKEPATAHTIRQTPAVLRLAQRGRAVVASDRSRTWAARYHWVIAFALYVVLTLAVTFPVIFHLNDSIIGTYPNGDNMWYVWYIWWFRTAIGLGQDPSFTHMIYALVPHVQIFAASTSNGALGALLLFVLSPLAAYNILVLLGFALSGFTMYLLANEFVKNRLACFVAGFLYTFTTDHFWRAEGHLDLVTLQWLPLLVWRVFAFYRRPTRMNAVWMGLSIAIVPLSDLYLSAYFLVPFALLFVIWLLLTDRAWLANRSHLLLAGLAVLITIIVALPPLYSSLFQVDPDTRAAVITSTAVRFTASYSSDLAAYFLPQPFNPLFGWIGRSIYMRMENGPNIEQANYLGWVTILLAGSAFLFIRNRTRTTVLWLALALTGIVMSLGPFLHVAGGGGLRHANPFYDILYNLPVLSNFRAPNRMGPTVTLALALLAAYTIESLTLVFGRLDLRLRPIAGARASRVALVAFCVVAMVLSLAEHIQFAFPFPSSSVHVPAVYYQMAADPTPGDVLSLPVYPRGSDQFYQTIHHRPLIGGYSERESLPMERSIENLPYLSFLYPFDSPIAGDPAAPTLLSHGDVYPITITFKQGLEDAGIRYVVYNSWVVPVAPNYPILDTRYPTILKPWMRQFLLQQLGAPIYDNAAEGVTAWRLDPAVSSSSASQVYRFTMGTGWLPGLFATVDEAQLLRYIQQDGQLLINAPHAGPLHLTMSAFAQGSPRTMILTLNGQVVFTHSFTQAFQMDTFDLGSLPLKQGTNILQMHSVEGCPAFSKTDPRYTDLRCFGISQIQMPGQQAVSP